MLNDGSRKPFRHSDIFDNIERQHNRIFKFAVPLAIVSALLSTVISCCVIAAAVFGIYWLATGEFLF